MDAELEFAIQPNTTGKQLFDQVGFCELKRAGSQVEKSVCSIGITLASTFITLVGCLLLAVE